MLRDPKFWLTDPKFCGESILNSVPGSGSGTDSKNVPVFQERKGNFIFGFPVPETPSTYFLVPTGIFGRIYWTEQYFGPETELRFELPAKLDIFFDLSFELLNTLWDQCISEILKIRINDSIDSPCVNTRSRIQIEPENTCTVFVLYSPEGGVGGDDAYKKSVTR